MKIVITPEAAFRLETQVEYIREQHAPAAAERLRIRVLKFIEQHLARFPRAGRLIESQGTGLWEMWIPKTRLVVWYQISDDTVAIVSVWHAAQDRRASGLNED